MVASFKNDKGKIIKLKERDKIIIEIWSRVRNTKFLKKLSPLDSNS
jgi:hypothetical protein